MDIKASIDDTRKGFEESFASGEFYNRQTQDAEHLERILAFIKVRDGMRILDLGCGSGYLTFPIAERNPLPQPRSRILIPSLTFINARILSRCSASCVCLL